MEYVKKVWVRPILIIIGRGAPEERVLSCKNKNFSDVGGLGCPGNGTTPCNQS